MLSFNLLSAFSFSIVFAAVLAVIRYKRALKEYRPFFFFLWIALLNEVISDIWIRTYHSSTDVSENIYTLVEFALLLWLFARWQYMYMKPRVYYAILFFGIIVWITDNLVLYKLNTENAVFRIFYSLVLVYLSITEINRLLLSREKSMLYNSRFIICTTFLVYYSYKATFEIFFMVQVGWSDNFYKSLFTLFVFVNLCTNLLYAFAVICIPTKQKFILPY